MMNGGILGGALLRALVAPNGSLPMVRDKPARLSGLTLASRRRLAALPSLTGGRGIVGGSTLLSGKVT